MQIKIGMERVHGKGRRPRGHLRQRALRALAALGSVEVCSPADVTRAEAEATATKAEVKYLAKSLEAAEEDLNRLREGARTALEATRWHRPAEPFPVPEHGGQRLVLVYQPDADTVHTVEEWTPDMTTMSWVGPMGTLYARKLTQQLQERDHHYPEPLADCVRWRVIDLPTLHTPF